MQSFGTIFKYQPIIMWFCSTDSDTLTVTAGCRYDLIIWKVQQRDIRAHVSASLTFILSLSLSLTQFFRKKGQTSRVGFDFVAYCTYWWGRKVITRTAPELTSPCWHRWNLNKLPASIWPSRLMFRHLSAPKLLGLSFELSFQTSLQCQEQQPSLFTFTVLRIGPTGCF